MDIMGHPRELAEDRVSHFLTHPAVKAHVAASTQGQALSAILFLYEHVLRKPLDQIEGVIRSVQELLGHSDRGLR
jgi:site-specific recombinase XerD